MSILKIFSKNKLKETLDYEKFVKDLTKEKEFYPLSADYYDSLIKIAKSSQIRIEEKKYELSTNQKEEIENNKDLEKIEDDCYNNLFKTIKKNVAYNEITMASNDPIYYNRAGHKRCDGYYNALQVFEQCKIIKKEEEKEKTEKTL